jgi:amino acid transporter
MGRLSRFLLGGRKDIRDPGIYHRMALIPFLAWVGLGADGLSSSAYGPDEAFRALGQHTYLAVGLAVATAITVFLISYSYSRIIEHFPHGGGGYVVATKLLGSRVGVVSGSALLVDYVLTITVSVASGTDAIFSFLRPEDAIYKLPTAIVAIVLLVLLNIRGVKESVVALMPIFLVFLGTHAILISWGILSNLSRLPEVTHGVATGFQTGLHALGGTGMLLLFLRAYSLGGGTYTGIEAVSNGLAIMRDPKVETGKRTMVYMAISLAVTAGGILVSYLLIGVHPVAGKTLNAVLAEGLATKWRLGPIPIGQVFIITTLVAEGALLFVAAQAGFIDGPRVMANMASDSWLPHRFAALSDRLTTQNGVLLMGGAALLALLYTKGSVSALVVMYSINVFVTFSLSELAMMRFYLKHRQDHPDWKRKLALFGVGALLCLLILAVVVYEKFAEGGWVTLGLTAGVVMLCFAIHRHYDQVRRSLSHLDQLFADVPTDPKREELGPCDPSRPTAVLLTGHYGGLGVHSVLTLLRMFPGHFTNIIFISVGVIDSGNFKGVAEVEALRKRTRDSLGKYVGLARRLGASAEYRLAIGTEVVEDAIKLGLEVAKEFPKTIFFSGKLIFEHRRWYHRFLHNETAYAIQHGLQFAGHPMVILPVRVRARELVEANPAKPEKKAQRAA